jgi:hypothetical protein
MKLETVGAVRVATVTRIETSAPVYAGNYRSAIARAKRILLAAGFDWSVTTGRYRAFGGPSQRTSAGVRVQRIGCSDSIAVHVYGAPRGDNRPTEERAVAALRAGGLPFDARGWLECAP